MERTRIRERNSNGRPPSEGPKNIISAPTNSTGQICPIAFHEAHLVYLELTFRLNIKPRARFLEGVNLDATVRG